MTTSPEKTMKLLCFQKAEKLWAEFTEDEKKLVRFGMFPASPMMTAVEEGYDARLLSMAVMDRAKADGGMIS